MTGETSQASTSEATGSKIPEDLTASVDYLLHHLDSCATKSLVFAGNAAETLQASASQATQGDVSEHCVTSNTRRATGHVGADQCTREQPESEINVWLSSLGDLKNI